MMVIMVVMRIMHTQCVSLKWQNKELLVVMKIWPTMEPP